MIQAFPEDTAPRFLVRDRDKIYGERFRRAIDILGVDEVVTAARSPWQNPYAERLIGFLRRECLDHVIVLDEVHLLRILGKYFDYYNGTRCHLSWPAMPRSLGMSTGRRWATVAVRAHRRARRVEFPEVGGLHHRYQRTAA